jgi:dihydrofolate reductase
MSISLDGFVAGPNSEDERVFFTRGADSTQWIVDRLEQAGAIAMGSRSYYNMAAFWPYSDLPFTAPMNNKPKIVFSQSGLKSDIVTRALAEAKEDRSVGQPSIVPTEAVLRSWTEPTVVCGDLVEEVARLKEQPGDFINVLGGASLAQNLIASNLIDEYRLVIHPVALGRGLPLFSGLARPLRLSLVSRVSFISGAVGEIYQVA